MIRLVCATANPDKVAEIQGILAGAAILLPRPVGVAEVVEDHETLLGNARLKAHAVCQATGLPAVADDTGLFIDALNGGPGVHTAYFAGPDATYAANRAKTLDVLAGVPHANRGAAFKTVALLAFPDGREIIALGACRGFIAQAERDGLGWGYDPLFIPAESDGRTFSQMSEEEKNGLSHRGRAFRALLKALNALRSGLDAKSAETARM